MILNRDKEGLSYYCRDLEPAETPQTIYQKVKEKDFTVLLQSSDSYIQKTSEFSIISAFPSSFIKLKSGFLSIENLNDENDYSRKIKISSVEQILTILSELLNLSKVDNDTKELEHLPFIGGLLGFISYDFIRYIEKLPENNKVEYLPELEFIQTKNAIVIDHKKNKLWIIAETPEKLDYLIYRVNLNYQTRPINIKLKLTEDMKYSFSEEAFLKAVNQTKEYIAQGEIYQANISIQFSRMLEMEPYEFYRQLYEYNPSPFCSYIHFKDLHVVCNSPERLIKSSETGTIETRPIAGTRGRNKDKKIDSKLEKELISSAKERSEHIMLVDLERNDLGKAAKYSTVEVDELFTIEKYSHVMHLVSNVKGKLDNQLESLDLIPAMFPGGTITGVPKVRCMEIIEEIEPVRRGLYTGSIGYIDYRGNMDLNIVIRTMILEELSPGNYNAKMQFGAGIVADSIGKHEYKECIKKGQAIFDLLLNYRF